MNAVDLPSIATHPRSCGYDLDLNELGFLSDSSSSIGDFPLLRRKIQEDGYLYLRGFFRREDVLKARKHVLDRLMKDGFLDPNYPVMDGVVSGLKFVNAQSAFRPSIQDGEAERVKTYQPDDLTRQNQPLLDLLYKGRLIEFFEGYFENQVRHFNYIWFRAVSPGRGTPPHCDMVYMGRGTPNLITTWMCLGDTPLDIGGLMILEKSHLKSDRLRRYLARDVDDYCVNGPLAHKIESGELLHDWDGALSKNPVSLREKLGGKWLTAEFQAGDVLFFTMRTIHASLDNQSNRVRLSIDTRYQSASEPIDERYAVENPAPYSRNFKKGRIC